MTEHVRRHGAEGLAALGICESLLLALVELKILDKCDAEALLSDVATTHIDAIVGSSDPEKHRAVAAIVESLIVSVRS